MICRYIDRIKPNKVMHRVTRTTRYEHYATPLGKVNVIHIIKFIGRSYQLTVETVFTKHISTQLYTYLLFHSVVMKIFNLLQNVIEESKKKVPRTFSTG